MTSPKMWQIGDVAGFWTVHDWWQDEGEPVSYECLCVCGAQDVWTGSELEDELAWAQTQQTCSHEDVLDEDWDDED